ANDVLAHVNYKANQKIDTSETVSTEGTAGSENIILSEDVVVNYTQPSTPPSPGGGGVATYILKFETNGGNTIAPLSKTKGTSIDLTVYKPVKEGFVFEGWYLDSALTKPVDKVTLNSNMTVYAKWSDKTDKDDVTLTFVPNGGSTVPSLTTDRGTVVDIDDYITLREGYTFEGWYLDKEFTIPVDTHTLHNDTTVYAKWSETPKPSQLTDEHYAYIIGRTDGLAHPAANITRAEVATIFFRLLTPEVRDGNLTKENQFDDVNADNWFCAAVSTLEDLGIIKGRTDTTFVPNAFITRAEYAAIASRFSDVVYNGKDKFTDIAGHWAEDEINEASHIGWIVGDGGKFRPDDYITRAEAMTLTNRVLKRIPQTTDDLLDDMVKWPDNMDTTMWYYLAVQEATNSHDYELKADKVHENWTTIEAPRDWTEYEK
ncbi:MAG: InlB B-repeat-containing protein, partial [Clostridia bacterium]|nr:InlB B-repeat-containing protein [Clostridia bacterium]